MWRTRNTRLTETSPPTSSNNAPLPWSEFLVAQNAKTLSWLCNTATAIAVDALRASLSLPVIGIEPAIKPAVVATKSGVVGVLATAQTIASPRFARLVENSKGEAEILTQACPGLVEQVEQGDFSGATRLLVRKYVTPLLARGADTLVLGCTHYPLLIELIRSEVGPGVEVIDPARAVSQQLRRQLQRHQLLTGRADNGELQVFSSGGTARLSEVIATLGFKGVDVREM